MKNLVGWFAVLLILTAYGLLTFDVLNKDSTAYNTLNLVGALGLAWRVYKDKNWSNFFLEIIFILIAIIALFKGCTLV